jgi:putative ABC transport system permease protein
MIIGVGAVIALVSIGDGAKERIEEQISSLGENLILILPGSSHIGGVRSGWGGRASLKPDDAEAIRGEVPYVTGVSAEVRSRSQVLAEGHNWNTSILGESPDYLWLRDWQLARGAMFSNDDVRRIAKYAVIGQTIVDQLFAPGENPVGRIIRVGSVPFQVIGVLAPKGFSVTGQDQDDIVIIPYTSHLRRISRRTFLDTIVVQVDDPGRFDTASELISDLLSARHRLHRGNAPDFTLRTQVELVERATASTRTMTLLLGGIAAVSLLVGGIGIMNIMLVSVRERTREIGIRIAIGAHDRDVLRQFLLEAVILSCVGGLLGVASGVLGSEFMARWNGWPVSISTNAIAVAVIFSGAVGMFFGFYPARRAARLDPITALRFE